MYISMQCTFSNIERTFLLIRFESDSRAALYLP